MSKLKKFFSKGLLFWMLFIGLSTAYLVIAIHYPTWEFSSAEEWFMFTCVIGFLLGFIYAMTTKRAGGK